MSSSSPATATRYAHVSWLANVNCLTQWATNARCIHLLSEQRVVPDNDRILLKLAIAYLKRRMNFHLPPVGTLLYKYLPPETLGHVFSNGKIRFSPLIEFNDPFELNTYPVEAFTEFDFGHALANQIYEVLLTKEEIGGSGPLVDLVKAYMRGEITSLSPYDFAMELGVKMAKKKFVPVPSLRAMLLQRRLARIMGAFCVSETFDNLLMWAHYSRNHEGFALGIDPSQVGDIFRGMAPVLYRETYPAREDPFVAASMYLGRKLGANAEGQQAVEKMFFTKSKDWSYEREWRAIRDSGCDPTADHKAFDINAQLVAIPLNALSSLYVGCRSSPDTAAKYVTMARTLNPKIQVFKCRPSVKSYSLEIQLYDEPWANTYPPEEDVI